jgi:hypothetical protein
MKQNSLISVLFAAVAFLAPSLNLHADVTAPTLTSQSLVSGSQYYLYNTKAKMYLCNGNDYGSEASLTPSDGNLVTITYDATNSIYTIHNDGNRSGYVFHEEGSNANKSFVDGALSTKAYWTIKETATGSKIYNIMIPSNDATYGHDKTIPNSDPSTTYGDRYFGWKNDGTTIAYPTITLTDANSANYGVEWLLVKAGDDKLYVAKLDLYNAIVTAQGKGKSTTEAEAVYNNSSSTIAQLEDAALKVSMNVTAPTVPAQSLVSGNSYYLYNTKAQMFLNGGNNYGSQTSLTSKAADALEEAVTLETLANGSQYYTLKSTRGYVFRQYSGGDKGNSFVDYGASDEHSHWTIVETSAGSQVYNIEVSGDDETFGPTFNESGTTTYGTRYFGWMNDGTTKVFPLIAATDANIANYGIEWQLINASDAALFMAKLHLFNTIALATAYGISTTDADAVYNNSSSTAEQLEAAVLALYQNTKTYTINITKKKADGWHNNSAINIDLADIATALGTDEKTFKSLSKNYYGNTVNGDKTNVYTSNIGFWLNTDGKVVGYGDGYFFVEYTPNATPAMYLGISEGRLSEYRAGDAYSTDLYLYYGTKYVTIHINVTLDKDAATLDENETSVPTCNYYVDEVTLNRTLKGNMWNTLCLPFSMDAATLQSTFGSDVKVATFSGVAADNTTLNFTSVTSMDANKPYIIMPATTGTTYTIQNAGTILPATSLVQTVGTTTFTASYTTDATVPVGSYFISDNRFYKSTSSTQKMKALRAYFTIGTASPAKAYDINVDGTPTSISLVAPDAAQQSYNVYGINGTLVRRGATSLSNLPKGIYLVNGKKMVVK